MYIYTDIVVDLVTEWIVRYFLAADNKNNECESRG